jgi:sialate O-acetylesterase
MASQPMPMPPRFPDFPFGEKTQRPRCVTLHNGHIAPLVPMSLRGVLWYQGENNAGDKLYVEKVRAMLGDWRKWFGDSALPFYFVQIATWDKANDNPAHTDGWAEVRDRQRRCLEIARTGMAVTIDIGDPGDMHPKNKADVGERLALWALANDYGKRLETSGPLYRELKIEGNKARLMFDHAASGLMIGRKTGRAPVEEDKAAPLRRIAIAGADKQWRWADARIEGNTVVCSHAEISAPVAVRYAWATNPEGANLYNRAGLPASPFSSDPQP